MVLLHLPAHIDNQSKCVLIETLGDGTVSEMIPATTSNGQQVLIMKERSQQTKGKKAQQNNIFAGKLLAELIKTSLGRARKLSRSRTHETVPRHFRRLLHCYPKRQEWHQCPGCRPVLSGGDCIWRRSSNALILV